VADGASYPTQHGPADPSSAFLPQGLKVRGKSRDPDSGPDPVAGTNAQPDSGVQANDGGIYAPVERSPVLQADPEPAPTAAVSPPVGAASARFRPLPVLSVLSALALALLVLLGHWQWQKYAHKVGLPPPETLSEPLANPVAVSAGLEKARPDFEPVVAEGLMDGRQMPVYAVRDGKRGYRLFSPLVMEAGAILVDRGFVVETELASVQAPSGPVQVRGVLRAAAPANAFTPPNDLAGPTWYWPDTKLMAAHLDAPDLVHGWYVAQTMVDPLRTGRLEVNPWADRGGANQIPWERHLGYALTWWGLALALVGVYLGFHLRTGRLRFTRG
jgi:surfeit locus 1 family protein